MASLEVQPTPLPATSISTPQHTRTHSGTESDVFSSELTSHNSDSNEDCQSDGEPSSASATTPNTLQRKRLHSIRDSVYNPALDGQLPQACDHHASKRARDSEWPLNVPPPHAHDAASDAEAGSPSPVLRSRRWNLSSVSLSRRPNNDHSPTKRPSKFKEGSMKDRASNQPPAVFAKNAEEAMELKGPGGSTTVPASSPSKKPPHSRTRFPGLHPPHTNTEPPATEPKQSGIFRFGKSIAAAFNPVNIWDGVAKMWSEGREDHSPTKTADIKASQLAILNERRAMAEEKYAELKKRGQLESLGKSYARLDTQSTPNLKATIPERDQMSNCNRDSGVDVAHHQSIPGSSEEVSRLEPIPNLASPTPKIVAGPPPETPPPSAALKPASFTLRKPSIRNLKKVKSEALLKTSSVSMHPVSAAHESSRDGTSIPPTLRRQTSKKDLQRQRKLSKKISDLEMKLEYARRQLQLSLSDVPPVPPLPHSLQENSAAGEASKERGKEMPEEEVAGKKMVTDQKSMTNEKMVLDKSVVLEMPPTPPSAFLSRQMHSLSPVSAAQRRPDRKVFTPGALSSLPSERILLREGRATMGPDGELIEIDSLLAASPTRKPVAPIPKAGEADASQLPGTHNSVLSHVEIVTKKPLGARPQTAKKSTSKKRKSDGVGDKSEGDTLPNKQGDLGHPNTNPDLSEIGVPNKKLKRTTNLAAEMANVRKSSPNFDGPIRESEVVELISSFPDGISMKDLTNSFRPRIEPHSFLAILDKVATIEAETNILTLKHAPQPSAEAPSPSLANEQFLDVPRETRGQYQPRHQSQSRSVSPSKPSLANRSPSPLPSLSGSKASSRPSTADSGLGVPSSIRPINLPIPPVPKIPAGLKAMASRPQLAPVAEMPELVEEKEFKWDDDIF
ncbi:MAG: hypothetical protein M1829_000055 [Trizodia sp. TS-e1964]|nr:MAG: hypothetical protein M1829_000055 [Trizodia sp. TS-e1964]